LYRGIGYFTGGGSSNLRPHEKRAAALSNRFCGVTADGYVHLLAHLGFFTHVVIASIPNAV
jgi:hypothetical protein